MLNKSINPNVRLTGVQKQVLEGIALGYSVKEIADVLKISIHTVNNHIASIKTKTGCQKQTELSAVYFNRKYNIPITGVLKNKILPVLVFIGLLVLQSFSGQDMARRSGRRGRRSRDSECVLDLQLES